MDSVELIIEWAKKERSPVYRKLAHEADIRYTVLKADYTLKVGMVHDLLEKNKELVLENEKLKKEVSVACHTKAHSDEEFDWDVLHRIWDLENALERIRGMCDGYWLDYDSSGFKKVDETAEKALRRSRGEQEV